MSDHIGEGTGRWNGGGGDAGIGTARVDPSAVSPPPAARAHTRVTRGAARRGAGGVPGAPFPSTCETKRMGPDKGHEATAAGGKPLHERRDAVALADRTPPRPCAGQPSGGACWLGPLGLRQLASGV